MKLVKLLFLGLLITSCASVNREGHVKVTKGNVYEACYRENPKTILVVPPINHTKMTRATNALLADLIPRIQQKGYNVLPLPASWKAIEAQGLSSMTMNHENLPLREFYEAFGADAVLLIDIHEAAKDFTSEQEGVWAAVSYNLVSTESEQNLWFQSKSIFVSTTILTEGDTLGDAIISSIFSSISTASTSQLKLIQKINKETVQDLPAGFYSPKNGIDDTETVYVLPEY